MTTFQVNPKDILSHDADALRFIKWKEGNTDRLRLGALLAYTKPQTSPTPASTPVDIEAEVAAARRAAITENTDLKTDANSAEALMRIDLAITRARYDAEKRRDASNATLGIAEQRKINDQRDKALGLIFTHLDEELRSRFRPIDDPAILLDKLEKEFTEKSFIQLNDANKRLSAFQWDPTKSVEVNISDFNKLAEACKLLGKPKTTQELVAQLLFNTELPSHLGDVSGRLAERVLLGGVWDDAGEPISTDGGSPPLNVDLIKRLFEIAKPKLATRTSMASSSVQGANLQPDNPGFGYGFPAPSAGYQPRPPSTENPNFGYGMLAPSMGWGPTASAGASTGYRPRPPSAGLGGFRPGPYSSWFEAQAATRGHHGNPGSNSSRGARAQMQMTARPHPQYRPYPAHAAMRGQGFRGQRGGGFQGQRGNATRGSGAFPGLKRCYNCRQGGHTRAECPAPPMTWNQQSYGKYHIYLYVLVTWLGA